MPATAFRSSSIGSPAKSGDDARVVEAVAAAGGKAITTRPDHASGSDRIFEALSAVDAAKAYDVVVNIQGDLPTIERTVVRACLAPLADEAVDIATLATPIVREEEKDDPNVVKAVGAELSATRLRALYFTRARAPWGDNVSHFILRIPTRSRARRRSGSLSTTIGRCSPSRCRRGV